MVSAVIIDNERHTIQTIRFSAIDYLLEPVDKADLDAALAKLFTEILKKTAVIKSEHLLQNLERIILTHNFAPQYTI